MNDLHPGPPQDLKVTNALRIPLAHDDHHRRPIDDPVVGKLTPIALDRPALAEPLSIAIDGENRDLRLNPGENLVRYNLRARKGRVESDFLPGLFQPLLLEGR